MGLIDFVFQRQLVGLDIGVSGIKAVELSGGRSPRLMAYNRVPLPWDAISREGEIKDRGVVITALQKLFENRAFSTKKVAVGAAGTSVITKKITVPRMKSEELSHQLYFEAEQYLPYSVSDVNLDFAILGNSMQSSAETPMMDVLLVAAKKDYVNSLTTLVKEAGLFPEIMDIQAFALGNAFEFNYGHLVETAANAINVIIDFGAGSTKLSVVEGDKTTFTRDLRQSGSSCTGVLSERLGIPLEQAERVKITEGGTDPIKNIIGEFVHNLVEEISRTLDFCISQNAERGVQGIYICGGASLTEGLQERLESMCPAPVQRLNPIQNIAGSGKKMNGEAIRELSYLGAVAIGLALRVSGDTQ